MSPVPSTSPASCPHDLGRGTTVCLRCRQESRDAARAYQQRMVALGGVIVMAFIGLYVMGASAANAWRTAKSDTAHVQPRASVVASSIGAASDVKQQGESAAAASAMARTWRMSVPQQPPRTARFGRAPRSAA